MYSSDSVIYTYIYSFSYSFLLWFVTGYWIQFSVLYSRTLLFIHSIYNSLPLLIPNSHSFPPLPTSPLATTSLFSITDTVSLGTKTYVLWIWNPQTSLFGHVNRTLMAENFLKLCVVSGLSQWDLFKVWLAALTDADAPVLRYFHLSCVW